MDSSIWIDLLRLGHPAVSREKLVGFATCGPVIQEILQGLVTGADNARFRRDFLSLPILSDPIPAGLYVNAAELYRSLRDKGVTVRSSADCLIAAIAMENKVAVWHRDRDFDAIARCTGLQTIKTV